MPGRVLPQEVPAEARPVSAQGDSAGTAPVPSSESPVEASSVSPEGTPAVSGPAAVEETLTGVDSVSSQAVPAAPDSASGADVPSALPATGQLQAARLISVVLPILLVFGLGVAGWLSVNPSKQLAGVALVV